MYKCSKCKNKVSENYAKWVYAEKGTVYCVRHYIQSIGYVKSSKQYGNI